MDLYSVYSGMFPERPARHKMSAREEDLYYARTSLPGVPWARLGSLAGAAVLCVVLMVGTALL